MKRTPKIADPGVEGRTSRFDCGGGVFYLTLAEGAARLRFDVTAPADPARAFRLWLERHAVPVLRRGRTLLVDAAVLDTVLRS